MAVQAEPNDATPFLPERRNLKDLRDAAARAERLVTDLRLVAEAL